MEINFVTIVLVMTILIGLISVGYIIYLIVKRVILDRNNNSKRGKPISPIINSSEKWKFTGENEEHDATVIIDSDEEENDTFARLQFTRIAGKPSNRIELLSKETTVIGRASDVDIRINDETISWLHLMLSFSNNELKIQDLGARNGTLLNGIRLTPRLLFPVTTESIVNIGKSSFVIHINI